MTTLPYFNNQAHPRVLIVEDSPSTRLSIMMMLGFAPEVEIVGTASTARELFESLSLEPNLILMDANLPDMEGFDELNHVIATLPATSRVVIMSVEETYENAALAAGADAFITKPFKIEQLLQVIRQFSPAVSLA